MDTKQAAEAVITTAQRLAEARKNLDEHKRLATLAEQEHEKALRELGVELLEPEKPYEFSGGAPRTLNTTLKPFNRQRGRPKGRRNAMPRARVSDPRHGLCFRDLVLILMAQPDAPDTAQELAEFIGKHTGSAPPLGEKVHAALQDAKRRGQYVSGPVKGTWTLTSNGRGRVRELESLGAEIAA